MQKRLDNNRTYSTYTRNSSEGYGTSHIDYRPHWNETRDSYMWHFRLTYDVNQ